METEVNDGLAEPIPDKDLPDDVSLVNVKRAERDGVKVPAEGDDAPRREVNEDV